MEITELKEQVRKLWQLRRLRDERREDEKLASAEYESQATKVQQILELSELDRFDTEDGTVSVTTYPSARMPGDPEAKEQFFSYLKEIGLFESLITVHSQSLNSFVKAQIEEEHEKGNFEFQIPGITISEYNRVSLRKK